MMRLVAVSLAFARASAACADHIAECVASPVEAATLLQKSTQSGPGGSSIGEATQTPPPATPPKAETEPPSLTAPPSAPPTATPTAPLMETPQPCANLGIHYGDRFIQVGDWRFGDYDGQHASIAHKDGEVVQIFRSDGTRHLGPRRDRTTWARPIGAASGISFGERFIQVGDWRFGDYDGQHASIAHKDGEVPQIYRSDGTTHLGPRRDHTTWARPIDGVSGISFGERFIQIGDWRFGDYDGQHASVAHKDGEVPQIYRSDGTTHLGPRRDHTTWARSQQTCQ